MIEKQYSASPPVGSQAVVCYLVVQILIRYFTLDCWELRGYSQWNRGNMSSGVTKKNSLRYRTHNKQFLSLSNDTASRLTASKSLNQPFFN